VPERVLVVDFGLLGPLTVSDGDRPVVVSAPRQRVLLAALLLDAGRVVSVDTLAEVLWDGESPAGARGAISGTASGSPTTTWATMPNQPPATSGPSACTGRSATGGPRPRRSATSATPASPPVSRMRPAPPEEALAILDHLRHPGAGQVRAKLAGLGANPGT
jgi:hypothetical protein